MQCQCERSRSARPQYHLQGVQARRDIRKELSGFYKCAEGVRLLMRSDPISENRTFLDVTEQIFYVTQSWLLFTCCSASCPRCKARSSNDSARCCSLSLHLNECFCLSMCVFFSLIEIAAGPETLWALCHHLGPWMKLIGALTDDCSCADVKVVKFCTHCNEEETHKSYWLSFIYHSTKANMTLYWKRRFFSPRMRRKEDFSPVTGLKVWTCKSDAVWALMDVF